MGRRNEGKTKTVKKRRITVYAPEMEIRERWQREADTRTQGNMSKFIGEAVEFYIEYMNSGVEEKLSRLKELERESRALKKRVESLMGEKETLEKLVAALEYDLNLCRKSLERPPDTAAIEKIDDRLISLLKSKTRSTEEIMLLLGVANDDIKGRADVISQLHTLLDLGLVKYYGTVWKWSGR